MAGRQMCGASLALSMVLHIFLFSVPAAEAQMPLGPFVAGVAGHYAGPMDVDPNTPKGAPVVGSCGYGELMSQTWPGFNASSISTMSALYMSPGSPLEGCGRCMEILCAAPACPAGNQSIIAQVVDKCDSCPADRFDLPYPVWLQYLAANPNSGTVPVQMRQVTCNPPGLIIVDVQELRTTLGGYIKLALDSVKGPGQLTGISIRPTPSPQTAVPAAWLPLTNTFGAVWEGSNLGGMPPYDLQISSPSAAVDAPAAIPSNATVGKYPASVQYPA